MIQLKEIIKKRCRNDKGFTLIEVIAVLVIVAIVSAVVISRGMNTDAVNLQAEIDILKSHLRYAQYLALNENEGGVPTALTNKWGISIGALSYTLVKVNTGGTTSPFNLPNESSATHSFSPIAATAWTVLFDEWGSPTFTGASPNIGGQPITITAGTGFIQ